MASWIMHSLLQAAAAASSPADVAPAQAGEVVVVWEGMVEPARERLRACLAQKCFPVNDVKASLALADAQFVNGSYDDARRTLQDSLQRLVAAPGEHPRLRASLLNGVAIVAEHQGDLFDAMYARGGAADALWSAGPDTVVPALNARIAAALTQARLGRTAEARATLRSTAGRAKDVGQPVLEQAVRMYDAAIQWRNGAHRPAERTLREVAGLKGENFRSLRVASAALLTQLLNEAGQVDRTGLLEEAIGRDRNKIRPTLIYSPTIDIQGPIQRDAFGFVPNQTVRSDSRSALGWIDMGYWVRPDGSVADVQVLRGARNAELARYIRDVAVRRRYAATQDPSNAQGWYEIRRFSLGYEKVTPIGSRIVRRAGAPIIAEMDLAVIAPDASKRETS